MGLLLAGVVLTIGFISGVRSIARSRKLLYYQLRQKRINQGWRLIFFSLMVAAAIFFLVPPFMRQNDLTLRVFPTATMTKAPTATMSAEELVASEEAEATETTVPTPDPLDLIRLPREVAADFTGELTPNPETVFSPLTMSLDLDLEDYSPIDAGLEFEYPVRKLVVTFSYDKMFENVQWTVVWYRNDEMVFYETLPWTFNSGGYGYAEVTSEQADLLPGTYLVEMYVGYELMSDTEFLVTGVAPTQTPTRAPTLTPTATNTRAPTLTPTATHTRFPTATP